MNPRAQLLFWNHPDHESPGTPTVRSLEFDDLPPIIASAPDASAAATIVLIQAATTLGGHRVVRFDELGCAVYADIHEAVLSADCIIGLTTGAALQNDVVPVLTHGFMTEPTWNWEPQRLLYLTVNGMMSQTPPTSGLCFPLGLAISQTTAFIALRTSIQLR